MSPTTAPNPPDLPDLDLDFVHRIRRRKRRRVPTVLQLEAAECGAACLAMMLASYGRWVPLETLRVECRVSRDGANARSIVVAARRFGLDAHGYSIELADLAQELYPVIAYWNFSHFVVVEGASRRGLRINDPARGRAVVSWPEADRAFTGLVLRMTPTADFTRGGEAPRAWQSLRWRAQGASSGLGYLLVAGIALAVPTLLAPMALQEFVDQYLVLGLRQWAMIVVATMVVAAGLMLWLTYWQGRVAQRLTLSLSARQASVLVRQALRLPVSFYTQRYPGEVASRLQLIDGVSQVVAQQLLPALLGVVTSLAVAVALFLYSWMLALIALATAYIVGFSLLVATPRRQEQALALARDAAVLSASVTYDLRSIETVKATGAEDAATTVTVDKFARVNDSRNRLLSSSAVLGIIPGFATGTATATIIAVGGLLVVAGDLEVGQFVAIVALLPLFLSPLTRWVNAASTLQQTKSWLVRLDDILDHPVDPQVILPKSGSEGRPELPVPATRLELKEVNFRYAPGAKNAVTDVTLMVEPGRSVALVGLSGSGKSTVARIAVGLLKATEGSARLSTAAYPGSTGKAELGTGSDAGGVGYVDQEIVLFKGTVFDNISMFDTSITESQVKAAARLAVIDKVIEARPGGYWAAVDEDGRNFSGGERQRIEIARVLVRNPKLVVLDEATSALDPLVEHSVMSALRSTGVGMLIVAHRLSTVRQCDEIIVMSEGSCAERGSHPELSRRDGEYARLVREA